MLPETDPRIVAMREANAAWGEAAGLPPEHADPIGAGLQVLYTARARLAQTEAELEQITRRFEAERAEVERLDAAWEALIYQLRASA